MLDVNHIRKDFPMLSGKKMQGFPLIYFDNAATTFKPQSVIDAVVSYYTDQSVNIHRGDYDLSYQVSQAYEDARETVAKFIRCKSEEVIFTSGASASLNLVAYGWGKKHLKENDVILTTEAEHASNILPWFDTAKTTKALIEYIPLETDGQLTLENIRKAMHSRVKVVTLPHISNVLGYIAPIKEIAEVVHEYGAILVVDGAQSVPHIPTDVTDWDVDFLSFSGHKMCAPTGIGVLYGKLDLLKAMDPVTLGGGSNARFDVTGNIIMKNPPFKFESGTPAIEALFGLKAAIDYLSNIGMEEIMNYEHELKQYLVSKIQSFSHITVYNKEALTGIVTFNANGIFAQDAATYISSRGIAVRSGHHCAKILMDEMGTTETLRASLYFYNTKEEIDAFVEVLRDITLEKCVDLFF